MYIGQADPRMLKRDNKLWRNVHLKNETPVPYIVEREFLSEISVEELLIRIIRAQLEWMSGCAE